jgi:hypothetical protein
LTFPDHSLTRNQYPPRPERGTSLLVAADTLAQTKLQQLFNQVQVLTKAVLATQGKTSKFELCFANFTNAIRALRF